MIRFVTKVSYNEIYQVITNKGRVIKVTISARHNKNNEKIWTASTYIENMGEWKVLFSESEKESKNFDNFLNKIDLILKDE